MVFLVIIKSMGVATLPAVTEKVALFVQIVAREIYPTLDRELGLTEVEDVLKDQMRLLERCAQGKTVTKEENPFLQEVRGVRRQIVMVALVEEEPVNSTLGEGVDTQEVK